MSHVTSSPRSAFAPAAFVLAALLAAASLGDTTPNAPTSDPPETTPGPKKGDPVGVIDGSVYASVVDLHIPCPGVDLVLKRAYGSWTTRTTALGYGWSHSLDWRLVRSGDGKNLVLYADADPASAGTGETHRFEELDEAGKTSISPSGGFVLSRVRGSFMGEYEVQTPGALLYRFSSEGVLLKILTPGGIGIRMERDKHDKLLRAVHDCGQSLTFSYDEEGRLTSVETLDPSVRVVYEYADLEGTHAGGLLVRAIRMDHGRASTNRYAWCRLTRAGVVNATPPLSPPRQETRWAIPARVATPWTFRHLPTHAAAMGSGGGGTISAGSIAMAARDAYRAESSDDGGFEMPAGFISDRMMGKVSLVALPSWYQTPYLLSQTDANGLETHYEYERPNDGPSVRCTRTFMTGGLIETRLAHLGGTTVVRRPIAGRMVVESHVCDTRRREVLCLVGDEEVSKEYDFSGNVSRVTVANTKTGAFLVRAFSYDNLRNVVREGRAFGGNPTRVRTQVWDERRRVPRYIVTPEGRVREWKERGRNINVYGAGTNDVRLVTRMYCTANDRPLAVVLPDGGRIDLSYDAAGYLSSVAASDRPAVSYTHDALGRVASVSRLGPEGARTTSYVRNARGRPLSVVHPDGTSESFAYDGNGTKVVAHVDALGRTDAYRWVLGQPVHASRVVAGTTNVLWSVAHDQQLNVVSLTDPSAARPRRMPLTRTNALSP